MGVPVEYCRKRNNQHPSPVSKLRSDKSIKGNILSRSHFLERLRTEKLRTDRSKTPLSLILLDFSQKETEVNRVFLAKLLSRLTKHTRETDVKGWVASDIIALLLLDTDGKGAKLCAERILNQNGSASFSLITATYPDDIFQRLPGNQEDQPDLPALKLDESSKPYLFSSLLRKGIHAFLSLIG